SAVISDHPAWRTSSQGYDRLEVFCNRVASEILLPQSVLEAAVSSVFSGSSPKVSIEAISSQLKRSRLLIAVRLVSNGTIDETFFRQYRRELSEEWRSQKLRQKEKLKQRKNDGGPGHRNLITRVGR